MNQAARTGFIFKGQSVGSHFDLALDYHGACPDVFSIRLSGHIGKDLADPNFASGSTLSIIRNSSLCSRVDQVLERIENLSPRKLDIECLHLLSDSISSWMLEESGEKTDSIDARPPEVSSRAEIRETIAARRSLPPRRPIFEKPSRTNEQMGGDLVRRWAMCAVSSAETVEACSPATPAPV